MKKLISLVLILCVACMLVPVLAGTGISGEWYLTEISVEGQSINPADLGMSQIYTFNEDGTMTVTSEMMGQKEEDSGTWKQDGDSFTFAQKDKEIPGKFVDGKIIIEMDGQTGILSKEVPVASEKLKTVAAESEEAFLGTWTLSAMDAMGIYVTEAQFESFGMKGYSGTLTIADGKVVSDLTAGEGQEAQKSEGAYTFADGKLTVSFEIPEDQAEMAKALGLTDMTSTIELVEDGSILYSMDVMGMNMGMYFVKTAD